MTQSFVRLAILHEGERHCCGGCPFLRSAQEACSAFNVGLLHDPDGGWERADRCLASSTQQALDDAVLEAAEAWYGAELTDVAQGRMATLRKAADIADELERAVAERRRGKAEALARSAGEGKP